MYHHYYCYYTLNTTLCACKPQQYETLPLKETHANWKRQTWCIYKLILNISPICVFFFKWRMCVHLLKGLNRAVAASSIRHSQQPFLVHDRAVRMHRLISPHWALRDLHSSFKKTERRDLRGVSIHKDRWIKRKERYFKHTECDSARQRTGTQCEHPESSPLSHSTHRHWGKTCPQRGIFTATEMNRSWKKSWEHRLKGNDSKYRTHSHPSLLNFPLTLRESKSISARSYIVCRVLRQEQTCLPALTRRAERLQKNGPNRQRTSHTSWEVNTRPGWTVCVAFPQYFTALAAHVAEITGCNYKFNLVCGRSTSSLSSVCVGSC